MNLNFDKIESLEAYFVQNNKNKIKIPVITKYLNDNIKESNDWGTKFYFPYEEKFILPITWDNTDTLFVEVNFVGVKNGTKTKYILKENYKKDAIIKDNVNLYYEAIMGV